MGIRTYVTAYKEVSDCCIGKTAILSNWMEDNLCGENVNPYNNFVSLCDEDIETLLSNIDSVISAEDKLAEFNKHFREDNWFKDYDDWFEDAYDILLQIKSFLQDIKGKDVTIMVSQW